jgi:hypothetical protein
LLLLLSSKKKIPGVQSGGYQGFAGSIRSIAVHPKMQIVAAISIDRFCNVYGISDRHMLAKVDTKAEASD